MVPLSAFPYATPSVRWRLLDTALRLFEQQGYATVSIADIAAATGQPLADAYRYFGTKDDFVLGFYQRLHDELEARVPELPPGPLAARFKALVS